LKQLTGVGKTQGIRIDAQAQLDGQEGSDGHDPR
jgi:hypothetical protein